MEDSENLQRLHQMTAALTHEEQLNFDQYLVGVMARHVEPQEWEGCLQSAMYCIFDERKQRERKAG